MKILIMFDKLQVINYRLNNYFVPTLFACLVPKDVKQQYEDNLLWIKEANQHNLVFPILHGLFQAGSTQWGGGGEHEKSQNFVAVAVFVAMIIQIFQIGAGTLRPPPV